MFYDPGMLVTPYTRFTGNRLHGRSPVLTPAWVSLEALFPRHPEAPAVVVPDGLSHGGWVRGFISGWIRWSTGPWLAVANYSLEYADKRSQRLHLADQLVPAHAVRRREDDRPL